MQRSLIILFLVSTTGGLASITPENLRCEYRRNPLSIDTEKPRLSWTLQSAKRAQRQQAYRILVASSEELLAANRGDLWDSGRVLSRQTAQVPYKGKPLGSHQRCFWKVRTWNQNGQPGAWSPTAEWSMGVLRPEDWKAAWIGAGRELANRPMPRFRKQFVLAKPVRRAVVYASAGGFFELYLNGAKVGDEVLAPLWTNYRKSVNYVAHDITRSLRQGPNAFAAEVGNGFFNVPGGRYVKFTGSFGPPILLVMARVEFTDGSVEFIGSNPSWKNAPGPTVFSCIHGGEDFDARRETPGWMLPEFDDSSWRGSGFDGTPGGNLVAQAASPVKVMKSYPAKKVSEPAPGVRVYDAGQNLAGWPRIRVRGRAGATVRMETAELLDAQGRLDIASAVGAGYRGPRIAFNYTLKGDGVEEWHPKFSYTGFRFVEVTGDAEVLSLEADFVHNSAARAGSFTSSNALFNRINELVDTAVRSNFQSVLTDCPHREKLGWLEVAHLMGPSILYNFDAATFFSKIARDAREAQLDNGMVPSIAPEYTAFRGGFRDSPEWGSAVIAIPHLLYRWFGDVEEVERAYDAGTRYSQYLGSMAREDIVTHGLGDWYDVGPGPPGSSKLTPKGVTATAFRFANLKSLAAWAALLARPADQAMFAAGAERVRQRFQQAFYRADAGYYATGSQTAQAMPLVLGMTPEPLRARVLAQLEKDIAGHRGQQTAGDIGYRFLIRALTDAGKSGLLFAMNSRTEAPSYGYQIAQGVTSLAEAWDANPSQSQNHCMLGHIQEWFITGLAGLDQAPGSVGFEQVLIRPSVVGDLTSAGAHYESIRGRIESRWRVEGDSLHLDVSIPVNATAEVHVPAGAAALVREGGLPAAQSPGVRFLRRESGEAVFAVGSGNYSFHSSRFRASNMANEEGTRLLLNP